MKVKKVGEGWSRNDDYVLAVLNITLGWNDNNRIMMSPLWQLVHVLESDDDGTSKSIGSVIDGFIRSEYQLDYELSSTQILANKLQLQCLPKDTQLCDFEDF